MRTALLAGSGADSEPELQKRGYSITRLDIDPSTKPDVVADMVALGDIGPFDLVHCSHALEHLYPHQVLTALKEFWRVLKPGGTATVVVPDLEDVRPTNDVLPGVGVSGLHLYYGDSKEIEARPYMAHHCGFIEKTLKEVMEAAGFKVFTQRAGGFNLVGIGIKE